MASWRSKTAVLAVAIIMAGLSLSFLVTCPCLQPISPANGDDIHSDQPPVGFPLTLYIQLEKKEFKLGENIPINMTLKNISNDNVTILFASSCKFWYSILTVDGEKLYDTKLHYVCFMWIENITLKPEERISQLWNWNQRNDNNTKTDLGCYTIRAETAGFSYKSDSYILIAHHPFKITTINGTL